MRLTAAAFAAALLAACQTPCPAPQAQSRQVRFTCEDGANLRVTFTTSPDVALVEEEGYTPLSLPARISGSGYRYVDGGAELSSGGMQVAWTRPGALETTCRETP